MLYNHNNNNIALHKHQTAPGVSQILSRILFFFKYTSIFEILIRTKCFIQFDNFCVFEIR